MKYDVVDLSHIAWWILVLRLWNFPRSWEEDRWTNLMVPLGERYEKPYTILTCWLYIRIFVYWRHSSVRSGRWNSLMVNPFHLAGNGVSIISSVNGCTLGSSSSFGIWLFLELWWVWWVWRVGAGGYVWWVGWVWWVGGARGLFFLLMSIKSLLQTFILFFQTGHLFLMSMSILLNT